MTSPTRPRINYWSPWPPDPSGIATYSSLLLPALQRRAGDDSRVTLIHPDARHLDSDTLRARTPEDVASGTLDGPAVDLFHFGNHVTFHHWMVAPLLRRGGIVVLHEWSLFDLMYPLLSRSKELWARERELNGVTDPLVQRRRQDHGFVMTYPMNKRIIDAADHVIVHTQWLADVVRQHFPSTPVSVIPLAGVKLPTGRISLQSPVVVLGGVGKHKRVGDVLRAFAQCAVFEPQAQLTIVGRADDPSELRRLRRLTKKLRLESRVTWKLDVDRSTYERELAGARCVVSLRPDTAGEMSYVLVEAWGASKVALTSDQPQFREFDEAYCRRVPLGDEAVDALAVQMIESFRDEWGFLRAGDAARRLIEGPYSLDVVATRYVDVIDSLTPQPPSVTAGVNVYGSWGTPSGLVEKSRRLADGLLRSGYPLTLPRGFRLANYDSSLVPLSFAGVERRPIYGVNLFTANVNEFHLIPEAMTGSSWSPRWNIGLWIYEFPSLHPLLAARAQRLDELWTASTFSQQAFAQCFSGPIAVVPDIVSVLPASESVEQTRRRWELDEHATMVLFSFDFASGWARKNPLAVVRAFRDATAGTPNTPAQLVIKASGLPTSYRDEVAKELATTNGVLIDAHVSAQQFADVLHACDVYASLHRAEGFGLGMAEAMSLGKTVLGTAYSGNLDFMNDENALLVSSTPRKITRADMRANPGIDHVVQRGVTWAEPDHDDAVDQLRRALDPDVREHFGPRAARTMAEGFSESVVVEKVRRRLSEFSQQRGGL